MERAAVLIGVKKTGNLPELQAVTSRIHELAQWTRSQGIPESRIKILTDESGEVRVHQITDAIEEIVGLATVEQLIVYFAGHGVNNRGEYWLLSRAPANPNGIREYPFAAQLYFTHGACSSLTDEPSYRRAIFERSRNRITVQVDAYNLSKIVIANRLTL